jgi:hypothetical protein
MAEGPSPSGHSLYREIRCNEVPYNESLYILYIQGCDDPSWLWAQSLCCAS